MELMEHQERAVEQLGNGKVLWGATGVGKSATALAYYMKAEAPRDIYVITTAKKRDSLDWEGEAARFGISTNPECSVAGRLVVDSWNNVSRYSEVEQAFFIFDEQRVVGSGSWVKNFIKIARKNRWILLSATPGDTWMDYAPVFIANGYFKNRTDFLRQHVVYESFVKYPKVRGYLNEAKLELLRNEVLVEMPYFGESKRIINWMEVGYDREKFDVVWKRRWNLYEDRPIRDVAELFRVARRVVNSDPSRLETIRELMKIHQRLIVFYNFDYELDILRKIEDENVVVVAEYNGHRKDPIPKSRHWVYLVQYVAGAESWNCTVANAVVFYSLTYSYKNFIQAQGRIDRLDNHYRLLYYYILVTNSVTDLANKRSLEKKEDFNERKFMRNLEHENA